MTCPDHRPPVDPNRGVFSLGILAITMGVWILSGSGWGLLTFGCLTCLFAVLAALEVL